MSAGKGDCPRHDVRAFSRGYEAISWGKGPDSPLPHSSTPNSRTSSLPFSVHVVFFDDKADHRWRIMADVLKFSLERFGHVCFLHELKAPEYGTVCKSRNNSMKLEKWNEIVRDAVRPVLLLDADMVCLRSLEGAFDAVEHVGITWRDERWPSASPLNGGCVYVNPTKWAKAFFELWVKVDARVLRDQGFARRYKQKWAGQNQAALGAMIETGKAEKLSRLECQDLNLCEPWAELDRARIVHVKGRMISMLWGGILPKTDREKAAVSAWREVYEEFKPLMNTDNTDK